MSKTAPGTTAATQSMPPRSRRNLDWTPKHDFEEALEKTVDWYLENMDWVNSVRSGDYLQWVRPITQIDNARATQKFWDLVETELAPKSGDEMKLCLPPLKTSS